MVLLLLELEMNYKEVLRELEIRYLGHRLAAEAYTTEDTRIKTATNILMAVVTALSYYEIFGALPWVSYTMAGFSTVGSILGTFMTTRKAAQLGAEHFKVSQKLEGVRNYCLAQTLKIDLTEAETETIVQQAYKDVQSALNFAPLLPLKYESMAKTRLDTIKV